MVLFVDHPRNNSFFLLKMAFFISSLVLSSLSNYLDSHLLELFLSSPFLSLPNLSASFCSCSLSCPLMSCLVLSFPVLSCPDYNPFLSLQGLTGVRQVTTATKMQTASPDCSATLVTVEQDIRLVNYRILYCFFI